MRSLFISHLLVTWFLFFFTDFSVVNALITSTTITSESTFGQYVQKQFGMAVGGIITVNYNTYQKLPSLPYNSYILILIINEDQRVSYYSDLDSSDSTVTNNINSLCTSPSMYRKVIQTLPSTSEFNYTVSNDNGGSDIYSVAVLQCRSSSATNNNIHAYVKAETKNPAPTGSSYNQLPIDAVMLVRLYLGEIIIYTLLLIGVCGQIYVARYENLSLSFAFLSFRLESMLYLCTNCSLLQSFRISYYIL
jgi:hypothetical protein